MAGDAGEPGAAGPAGSAGTAGATGTSGWQKFLIVTEYRKIVHNELPTNMHCE